MQKIRKHSFEDETYQIGIDFDGVIHKNSKGFYDGTVYDDPVPGSKEALEFLSSRYKVIVFSAKARPDRMLINNKTGVELIWEWLKKHDMDKYVEDVTSEKPRAVAYVDDKAFRFSTWSNCIEQMKKEQIINDP
tara:strand:- start:347 stop:748 length:402 start_codon:yes stop_codon:yes gene_type:complete